MPCLGDRTKESTTTTGTGDITLDGAPTGFQSFNTTIGIGRLCVYVIDDGAGGWEIGRGYLSNATTLVRDTVVESSNANNLVNFSAGTKTVFVDVNDEYVERLSRGRNLEVMRSNFLF